MSFEWIYEETVEENGIRKESKFQCSKKHCSDTVTLAPSLFDAPSVKTGREKVVENTIPVPVHFGGLSGHAYDALHHSKEGYPPPPFLPLPPLSIVPQSSKKHRKSSKKSFPIDEVKIEMPVVDENFSKILSTEGKEKKINENSGTETVTNHFYFCHCHCHQLPSSMFGQANESNPEKCQQKEEKKGDQSPMKRATFFTDDTEAGHQEKIPRSFYQPLKKR